MTVATCFRINLAAHIIHRAFGLEMKSGLESVWIHVSVMGQSHLGLHPPAKINMGAPNTKYNSSSFLPRIVVLCRCLQFHSLTGIVIVTSHGLIGFSKKLRLRHVSCNKPLWRWDWTIFDVYLESKVVSECRKYRFGDLRFSKFPRGGHATGPP